MAYTYDPANVTDYTRDRMRFELGDVMVANGAETCALTDEEYDAILARYPESTQWRRAKLEIIKSVLFRFSYEVDTKVGQLSLALSDRYSRWKALADELEEELVSAAVPAASPKAISGKHYFWGGMHDNRDGLSGKRGKPERRG